ncbi:ATP-dependent exoDNAse (exonuclease V) beta subunit (contains helicase and exonuclease domains) [Polaribacter sp. KT25b]|uniref:UvrD-helicase domain-containing protein n=1 Tax=Polaribacter sp. KT25b TaxID=1855336 RepID=UPI00087AB138|nr:UvrD-helicase domain-containing protein [Polaribacter sp. KT25b]SDS37759.1 ATP-dependent exoDNAse (exonuclease V) beta subunit (contains helicase and exonuclease domains) [Polaribacter sp. KT25b]
MQELSTFHVYNASAGSGKTFTLVKEYLKVLLDSEDIFKFQKVLAITFTNKAAGEMKERVLSNLEDFADGKENDLFKIIINEIAVDKPTIQIRSKKILEVILQNYSAFSITTIDSFTHKIIKSFAYDLGLPLNFEVEMDAVSLLNEAVDILISKIGTDRKLTKLLIDYSLDKTDDDKSWDISRDLNEFAKVLLNEDDIKHFRALSVKNLEDFTSLKSKLFTHQKELKEAIKKVGEDCLELIENNDLVHKDFMRATIPKFFTDLSVKSVNIDFLKRSETIERAIDNHQYYAKSTKDDIAAIIENIVPEIVSFYQKSKEIYSQFLMNKLALKNIIPLAVLNNINQELEQIKEDNNIRLNSEFNQLISDNIKEQPAPFIYEKIGQRFQHYFIDEMQDTSVLQWQNLIPLIDNALAQESSNLLLVGDGKQAIYRWRGGKAEQFIELGSDVENPFHIGKEIRSLETNFRSYSEVINFNNSFFQHTANFLQNESYKNLFIEGNKQIENAKKGGFVSLTFLEDEKDKEEKKLRYPKKVLEKIKHLKNDFSLNEICILTRTKKDGVAVANYLSENGIDIISSETLLLQNSAKVNFIIDVLKVLENPNDEETRFEMLYFLHQHLQIGSPKHIFLKEFAKADNQTIFESIKSYGISFEIATFHQLPFYEKIEDIIRGFNLVNSSDAYVQFFLDVVLEQQRKSTDVAEFLEFWEIKKDKLSIVAPESKNAVQIMTIHKSKGLEFPVVIFPCDVDIYRQINPKVWLDELPENYDNFSELLVDYNKSLSYVNNTGLEIYNQQREELELDNFNLLYVVLTRAVEQLYVITEKKISSKGEENTDFYSGVFINYLMQNNLWNDELLEYTFGDENRVSKKEEESSLAEIHEKFISTPWQEHNVVLLTSASKLWNTTQGEAINFGNLFHEMLSKIITKKDVDKVVEQYQQQGFIDENQSKEMISKINAVVNHPELINYFSEAVIIYNEREIVDFDNQIMIPDRLIFTDKNEVVIIDYKTGNQSKEHHQQVLKYERVLKSMNFKVGKKLLIYINDKIDIIEI